MDRPSVSVIIPTNRGGPFLDEAVASVRAQTVPVAEVILVDDGSPAPGLGDVAARLGLRYLRQEPSGIAAARNLGVAHATGEWVAFLDDDDVWHPERIEEQLRALDARSDAVACGTGGWYMDGAGQRFGEDWWQHPASSQDLLAGRVPLPRITTLTIRRQAYLDVGGCDSDMEPAEDNDLVLRLVATGEVATVPRPLVGYRRHGGNLSSSRLRGRLAGDRVVRTRLAHARRRGDGELTALLRVNLRLLRRRAALENLRDLRAAVRERDWQASRAAAAWAIRRAPSESAAALWQLVRRRGTRR